MMLGWLKRLSTFISCFADRTSDCDSPLVTTSLSTKLSPPFFVCRTSHTAPNEPRPMRLSLVYSPLHDVAHLGLLGGAIVEGGIPYIFAAYLLSIPNKPPKSKLITY